MFRSHPPLGGDEGKWENGENEKNKIKKKLAQPLAAVASPFANSRIAEHRYLPRWEGEAALRSNPLPRVQSGRVLEISAGVLFSVIDASAPFLFLLSVTLLTTFY